MRSWRPGISRLLQLIVTLWGASVVIWSMIMLAPGDPARRLLIARGIPDPLAEDVAAARRELRLDQPVVVRYVRWLGDVVRGDFGTSWRTNRSVLTEFGDRFGATAVLGVATMVFIIAFTVPMTLIATRWRDQWPDKVMQVGSSIGTSLPSFLVSLVLLHVAVLEWGWGSVLSDGSVGSVWLPASALSMGVAATWTRLLRGGMVGVLDTSLADVCRSRGAGPWRIMTRVALPNALVRLLPFMALTVGALVGGAAVVESVVDWPGMGSYLVDAINARDLPVIQAFVLLATFAYVVTATGADVLARRLDPRLGIER